MDTLQATKYGILNAVDIATFIFAGNATFTLENKATGKYFTYKVKKHKTNDVWFFSLLTGSDNETSYTYFGYCRSYSTTQVYTKAGGEISDNAPSVKGINWLLNTLVNCIKENKPFPEYAEFYHAGTCGRCGRKLTVPESCQNGIGPECANKL